MDLKLRPFFDFIWLCIMEKLRKCVIIVTFSVKK